MKYKFLALFFLLMGPGISMAQSYEKEYETLFAWEVKQVDEFIERFNDNQQTLILIYLKKNDPTAEMSREKLIKNLFNAENKSWNINDLKSFITKVDDKQKPLFLDFFGGNWYAKVNCSVTWNGKPQTANLTLMIEKLSNGGSKWVITGVTADFLKTVTAKKAAIKIPPARDTTTSLNPLSHTTEFMNIDHVSTDKVNVRNYFLNNGKENDDLLAFENEILNNSLVINKTNSVSYCFNQIPGWSFTIEQFNRQSKNSGWLISKLEKTSTP